MTVQEVANRFVELFREGKMEEIYQELYSPEIESVEPQGAQMPYAKGFEAIGKKGEEFRKMVAKVHSSSVTAPIVAENFFTVGMYMNVDMVDGPQEVDMDEICIYEVHNSKIIKEEFRYTVVPQEA